MSVTGEIKNLYSDKDKTRVLLPRTKTKAVSDENGVGLDTLLNEHREYTKKVGNPRNLLDNSDFRNPVNQRGKTTFAQQDKYWIDRWIVNNEVYLDIKDDCIGINATGSTIGGIVQKLENMSLYAGKKLTLAVCARSPGSKMKLSFPYVGEASNIQLNNDWNIYTYTVTFNTNQFNGIGIYSEKGWIGVKWAALYEGEYTAETLPEYQPKGYGAELAECQRYYFKFDNNNDPCWLISVDTSFAVSAINYPVRMRVNPTITNLRCLNLNSQEITITSLIGTSRGASYANGTFTKGAGYRVLFEASADL